MIHPQRYDIILSISLPNLLDTKQHRIQRANVLRGLVGAHKRHVHHGLYKVHSISLSSMLCIVPSSKSRNAASMSCGASISYSSIVVRLYEYSCITKYWLSCTGMTAHFVTDYSIMFSFPCLPFFY